MTKFQVARGLSLDPDYIGAGTLALLAKKGAGKSYASRVFAEEFWRVKIPFVLFDPMGINWGVRASADGKGDGIPVAIFGGKHGDAPLERGAGKLMADLVIKEGLSMVLDYSSFGSHAAEREFMHAFLDHLYFHNDQLVHLLIDEADLFAPQQPQTGDKPLLGVMNNVVRRGRNRGIGCTLMTQRPAVLNKDVLTQIDALVAMRVIGLPDREAVDHWVKGHGEDPEQAATVKATLAGLENGESWWWIPEQGILKRVQIRKARTFDSSPSRKRGARQREPKSFADVDMGAIEEKMVQTIERAKAEDPKELQKRITELERQVKEGLDPKVLEEERNTAFNKGVEFGQRRGETKEVPALEEGEIETMQKAAEEVKTAATEIAGSVSLLHNGLEIALQLRKGQVDELGPKPTMEPPPAPVAQSPSRPPDHPKPRLEAPSNGSLSTAAMDILNALASFPDGLTRSQVSLLTGRKARGGNWWSAVKSLLDNGFTLDHGDRLQITSEGAQKVPNAEPLSKDQIIQRWRASMSGAACELLDIILAEPNTAHTLADLAERTGRAPRGGNWWSATKSLRESGIVEAVGRDALKLSPDFSLVR